MRDILLTTSLLALVSANAMAQAPQGVIPTAAVAQRTEPGRYWVFFAWNRADLPPDGRKVVEEAAQSFLSTGSARLSLVGSADRTGSPAFNGNCRHGARTRCGPSSSGWACRQCHRDTGGGRERPDRGECRKACASRSTAMSRSTSRTARRRRLLRRQRSPPHRRRRKQAKADPWQLSITPYLWAVALKGDLGVGRIDANVDASFDDILDNLNGALMLEAELRKGRFGMISDTIYANLEDNAATGEDRLKVDATANLLIQSLAGTYRVGTWQLADLGAPGRFRSRSIRMPALATPTWTPS